jgi:hypothetical protein
MKNFEATAIAAQEMIDINTFALVLAEHPDGSGRRVEIQKALTFDEQDRQSGQSTYCICSETGAAHYGGIANWVLGGNVLRIVFSETAALVFGADQVQILFPPANHSVIETALRRLLNDSSA